jgi:hypothetical protein
MESRNRKPSPIVSSVWGPLTPALPWTCADICSLCGALSSPHTYRVSSVPCPVQGPLYTLQYCLPSDLVVVVTVKGVTYLGLLRWRLQVFATCERMLMQTHMHMHGRVARNQRSCGWLHAAVAGSGKCTCLQCTALVEWQSLLAGPPVGGGPHLPFNAWAMGHGSGQHANMQCPPYSAARSIPKGARAAYTCMNS